MRVAIAVAVLLLGMHSAGGRGGWGVAAAVTPPAMGHDARPVLTVHTVAGAVCSAIVTYDDGKRPTSFRKYVGVAFAVPRTGILTWRWHELSHATGGAARVECRYRGLAETSMARFSIR